MQAENYNLYSQNHIAYRFCNENYIDIDVGTQARFTTG